MAKIKRDQQPDASLSDAINHELSYLRSKVHDLSSLIEVSIIINSTLDLDELIELVMEKAQAVMKAEASSVMLINEEQNTLECAVALGEVGDQVKKMRLQMGEGIAGWVAQHGEPQIVPDVDSDARFSAKMDQSTGFRTRSILAAPLKVKDRVIGVAEVINRVDGRAFDEEDMDLFLTFCRQVAMAIDNAKMHQLQLEKQRIEQELESARIIQQSFMPEPFPASADLRFAVAAKSLPAESIGGDFYDFVRLDEEHVGVAVGDVTGKGVPAALFMARLVSDLRLVVQKCRSPADVVIELNKTLVERSRRGMFVTFQYGILNASDGSFIYANAGHLPFLHVGAGAARVTLLQDGKGIPMGIASELPLQEAHAQLEPGDFVVLITDGIVEARSESGDEYSLDRTIRTLQAEKKDPHAVVDTLLQDVMHFAQNAHQHDDLTILALQWTG